jgi:hypothetical protein
LNVENPALALSDTLPGLPPISYGRIFEILGICVKVLLTVISGNMFPSLCMLLPSLFENFESLEQDLMPLGTSLQPTGNFLKTKPK